MTKLEWVAETFLRYPERFAQEALGHNTKAVHCAHARNAQVIVPIVPPLEEYERKPAREKVLKLPSVEKTEKESTGLGDAHA